MEFYTSYTANCHISGNILEVYKGLGITVYLDITADLISLGR